MSFKQKVCENNFLVNQKMLCLQLTVFAVCSAPNWSSDWWSLQKQANPIQILPNMIKCHCWLLQILYKNVSTFYAFC